MFLYQYPRPHSFIEYDNGARMPFCPYRLNVGYMVRGWPAGPMSVLTGTLNNLR